MTETETPAIRNLQPEERKRYYRDNKRKNRLKNKKCVNDGKQAVVRDLITHKFLCDTCDRARLVTKYQKKSSP
jgi:hypothetical protein